MSDDHAFRPPPGRTARPWRLARSIARRYGALGLALLAGACAVEDRAQALFYRQHRTFVALTSTIIEVEPSDPDLAARLYDREDELHAACEPLNLAGQRRMQDQEIDDDLRWEVFQALDGCAEKTREVEHLIRRVDPNTARRFLDISDPAS